MMKRLGAFVTTLVASALLIIAMAGPVVADSTPEDKLAATQTLLNFLDGWASADPRKAARFCHEPLTYLTPGYLDVYEARADIEIVLVSASTRLKRMGWDGRLVRQQMSAKALANTMAAVSLLGVFYANDGQEIEKVALTYLLRKDNDGWKVAIIAVHDASSLLKLE